MRKEGIGKTEDDQVVFKETKQKHLRSIQKQQRFPHAKKNESEISLDDKKKFEMCNN